MKIRIEHTGKFTTGYYNDMEAGHPVFIDGDSLSDLVRELLENQGLDNDFCYYELLEPEPIDNPLIGCKVKLTLEIDVSDVYVATIQFRKPASAYLNSDDIDAAQIQERINELSKDRDLDKMHKTNSGDYINYVDYSSTGIADPHFQTTSDPSIKSR